MNIDIATTTSKSTFAFIFVLGILLYPPFIKRLIPPPPTHTHTYTLTHLLTLMTSLSLQPPMTSHSTVTVVAPQPQTMVASEPVQDNMVISIISIFFCCILGIIATIKASDVSFFSSKFLFVSKPTYQCKK